MGIRADEGHQLLPQKSADQLRKRGAKMRKHIDCVDLQINPVPGKLPCKFRILANAVISFAVGESLSSLHKKDSEAPPVYRRILPTA
mgnify:CR=1 FL=1